MTSPITIRRAGPTDGAALADIGATTFTQTFGHLYPAADLAKFLEDAYAPRRIGRLLDDPACAAWIVEQDGRAIGHALAGPCDLPHPDVGAACGEIKRLYLSRGHQGLGLGHRLLAEALNWLQRDGPRQIWIGVWSENHGALRLYRRFGFEIAGRYEFPVGSTRDQELILRRPAAESP